MDSGTPTDMGNGDGLLRPPTDFVTPETLNVASSHARMRNDRWRQGNWEALPAIADRSMIAYLLEQAAGWSTASDPATRTQPAGEQGVASRAVLAGYLAGRTLVGSIDRLIRWPADCEVDGIYALFDATENMDLALLPMPASEPGFLHDIVADFGWADHEDLLSLGAMAFDSALACALLEHDRFGS